MMSRSLIGLFVFALLTSCSYFHTSQSSDQYARCQEMKKMIVLNGATTDANVQQVQRAGLDRLNQDYNKDCGS